MKTRVISQGDYIDEFGAQLRGSGADDPETQALYRKAERLIVEPDPGDELKNLRHSLQGRMRRLAKREKLKAKLRFAVNAKAKHLVIWKEPAAAPAKPAPASTNTAASGRTNGRASAQQERRTA